MTGPCTSHPWVIAASRCGSCADLLCHDCVTTFKGADGSSRCIDCALADCVRPGRISSLRQRLTRARRPVTDPAA